MALRTFALMKIANSTIPQPFTGSWVVSGLNGPSTVPITLTLGTACASGSDASQIFLAGDHALLINHDGSNAEDVTITAVLGNTLTLGYKKGLQPPPNGGVVTELNHASGAIGTGSFILLNNQYNNYYCQTEDGNTGNFLYIGNAWNMTATFRRIAKMAKVASASQPTDNSDTMNFFGNPFVSSELWIFGTAADQWTPTYSQV